MAEDPNKAQEEAKKKQEEQRRLQEEAKTRESSVRSSQETTQKATESLKPQEQSNKQGYSQAAQEPEENKPVADSGTKPTKLSWSTTTDPYANSIRGRSYRQTSHRERNAGIKGEAEQARDIRRMGDENLKRDSEYLQGAFGLKKDAWNPANTTKEIIRNLEKQTGIKAGEGTQGLGNYSERDLAKYLSNPQVKTYVDGLKSGTQQIKEIASEKAPRFGEPGYKTDFEKRVAQYKETTKGQRLDTARQQPTTTAQRVDPLQPMGGQIMGGIPKMGGGVYGPGGYGAEKVLTNQPAKTQQELEQRMAEFRQAGKYSPQNIASTVQKYVNRLAGLADDGRQKGAYLPGGEFIANQPKNQGGETDEQRIARREKELGIGRFASKPSYFDDKARGRRII